MALGEQFTAQSRRSVAIFTSTHFERFVLTLDAARHITVDVETICQSNRHISILDIKQLVSARVRNEQMFDAACRFGSVQ